MIKIEKNVIDNFIKFIKENLNEAIDIYKDDEGDSYDKFTEEYKDSDLIKTENWKIHSFDPDEKEMLLVFDDGRLYSWIGYNDDFSLTEDPELELD